MKDIDSILSKAIKQSRLKMPNADFEERVMFKIMKEKARRSRSLDIKYAFIFFTLFSLLGFFINSQLDLQNFTIRGISYESIRLVFQAVFVLCFLIQADYLIQVMKRKTETP